VSLGRVIVVATGIEPITGRYHDLQLSIALCLKQKIK